MAHRTAPRSLLVGARGQAHSGGLSVGAFVSLVSVTRRIGRIVVVVSDRVVAMQHEP